MSVKILEEKVSFNLNPSDFFYINDKSSSTFLVEHQLRNKENYYKIEYKLNYKELDIYRLQELNTAISAYSNLIEVAKIEHADPLKIYEDNQLLSMFDNKKYSTTYLNGSTINFLNSKSKLLKELKTLNSIPNKKLILVKELKALKKEKKEIMSHKYSNLYILSVNKTIQKLNNSGKWFEIFTSEEIIRKFYGVKEFMINEKDKESFYDLELDLEKTYNKMDDMWHQSKDFDLFKEMENKLIDKMLNSIKKDMKSFLKKNTELYKIVMF